MKGIMRKMATVAAGLALFITSSAVNSVCLLWVYQPELPEGADSLRKK